MPYLPGHTGPAGMNESGPRESPEKVLGKRDNAQVGGGASGETRSETKGSAKRKRLRM